ncbi:MAG TPA: hypothetical protein VJI46_04280 [Candidatus Nanoarchaeia archaeon]|nr:hypothetical protein [Candidatus Nanoarchaeia archaeon]
MGNLEFKKKEGKDADSVPYALPSDFSGLISKLKLLNIDEAQFIDWLKSKRGFEVPVSVFSARPLGILESLSKYLHENVSLSFSQISTILNRDPRTIWTSYHKAASKMPEKMEVDYASLQVPIAIFQNRKYGTLESLVRHLKNDKGMKFSGIAKALKRDDRTVWTVYSRSNKK